MSERMIILPCGLFRLRTIKINVRCRTQLIYINAARLSPPLFEKCIRAPKSRLGKVMFKFKLNSGIAVIILQPRCRARPTRPKGGGGGLGRRWRRRPRGRRTRAAVAVADMLAAAAAVAAAVPAAAARVTSAPDRQDPVRQRRQVRAGQLTSRGHRSATAHAPANNSVGQRTPLNSTGSATRNANVNPNLKSHAVRSTLNSPSVAGALHNRSALRDPRNRSRITAAAATAGWHNGRDGGNGWWRHGNGGYGWVGPLYWPFAYNDMYDYALWGYGYDNSFWGYGYGDIYAGIFAPYGYDDLTGYMPQYAGATQAKRRPHRYAGPRRPTS